VAGVAAALLLMAGVAASAHAASATATVLTQRNADGTSVLTVSASAVKAMWTLAGDSAPSFGTVLDYRAKRAIAFDPRRGVYVDMSIDQAVARVDRQRQRALQISMLPEGVPAPAAASGTDPVHQLPGSTDVRGVLGKTRQVRQGGTTLRVTDATSLPQAPAALRRGLSAAPLRSDPLDRTLGAQLGSIPLQVQVQVGAGWQTTLATTRVQRVVVRRATFAVPRGLAKVDAAAFFGSGKLGGGPTSLVQHIDPTSPVVLHPRVTGLDWFDDSTTAGHQLAVFLDNKSLEASIRKAYAGKLSQYGVVGLPGKHTRSHHVGNNPPRSVGANDPEGPLQVWRMVWDQMIKGRAPQFWQCCGEDPMIFVFVYQEDVGSAPWGGYHFWVPTLGALAPWPLSLWIEPGVPYTLIKVPRAALTETSPTDKNRALASEEQGHEFVEAATDPFPFYGWVDLGREPVWLNGEISDMCANDPHSTTQVESTFMFDTFWSNLDQRCVP
jgi:hypothetical protein